jgi:hypothetical protein
MGRESVEGVIGGCPMYADGAFAMPEIQYGHIPRS